MKNNNYYYLLTLHRKYYLFCSIFFILDVLYSLESLELYHLCLLVFIQNFAVLNEAA